MAEMNDPVQFLREGIRKKGEERGAKKKLRNGMKLRMSRMRQEMIQQYGLCTVQVTVK